MQEGYDVYGFSASSADDFAQIKKEYDFDFDLPGDFLILQSFSFYPPTPPIYDPYSPLFYPLKQNIIQKIHSLFLLKKEQTIQINLYYLANDMGFHYPLPTQSKYYQHQFL